MNVSGQALEAARPARKSRLNREQIVGFWAAWFGWTLDGMDSVIYALVLIPALKELLPRSGYAATPGTIGFAGSLLFALFLVGWGFSYIWGPLADRFGRVRVLAATTLCYAVFTGLAAFSGNIWELALFRFLAGVGVGGEWALAGTYVAESWPEDRRRAGAGYLQTGYYAGFFLAAALNYAIGTVYGWRVMFLCGLLPVVVALYTLFKVPETRRWERTRHDGPGVTAKRQPLREIFAPPYRQRTIVNCVLVTVGILGLWGGSIYLPSAVIQLAERQGIAAIGAAKLASVTTAIYSIGTILGCLALPSIAERFGRRATLGGYYAFTALCLIATFGWAFYLRAGLVPFIALSFFVGFGGGNAAMYALWLPEQYPTSIRATAFSFSTSIGRFFAAAVSLGLGVAVNRAGTLGMPIAVTASVFIVGIVALRWAMETRGAPLPE
ncbi:MFS transporter [Paraburkholderia sp.]|uniref:MFS transporter n=1 Tax=Paraburkholderia sp. TaxID=1926495 RepID=UPI003D6F20BB